MMKTIMENIVKSIVYNSYLYVHTATKDDRVYETNIYHSDLDGNISSYDSLDYFFHYSEEDAIYNHKLYVANHSNLRVFS